MRAWRSHKRVVAEPIDSLVYNAEARMEAVLEDGERVQVPDDFTARGYPHQGDYLVVYEDGYMIWSPRAAFESGYTVEGGSDGAGLDFAAAMAALKAGKRLARDGWNGRGMFIFMVGGSRFLVNREPLLSILGEGAEVSYHPHIDMKGVDGTIHVWTPSQLDLMATDWRVVG